MKQEYKFRTCQDGVWSGTNGNKAVVECKSECVQNEKTHVYKNNLHNFKLCY